MKFSGFKLLLRKQLAQKWGRFLLASGGIMIGVWAITLTSSLSFGLSDTLITAINSQAIAKEIRLYRTSTNQTTFREIREPPTFLPLSISQTQALKEEIPRVTEIIPAELLGFYLILEPNRSCVELKQSQFTEQENFPQFERLCPEISFSSNVFKYFYELNRTNWVGSTKAPQRGEITVCFQCGSLNLNQILNAQNPEDLLGREITLEFRQSPNALESGRPYSVISFETSTTIEQPKTINLRIVSVVDDREAGGLNFTGGSFNFYVDFSYFLEAVELKNPGIDLDKVGYVENLVYVENYDDVEQVVEEFKQRGYLPLSLALSVISGIRVVFRVLTLVLAGFGFIALVASIFGIVNVMTISVLERKKEIGILKSLGARDYDIFLLFFLESSLLGIIGWLLGTGLALGFGGAITLVFRIVTENNQALKENLEALNVYGFSPTFPWWLLGLTFLLAIGFTSVSGIIPAIRAGKQNPVDVLRSE